MFDVSINIEKKYRDIFYRYIDLYLSIYDIFFSNIDIEIRLQNLLGSLFKIANRNVLSLLRCIMNEARRPRLCCNIPASIEIICENNVGCAHKKFRLQVPSKKLSIFLLVCLFLVSK